MGKSSIKSINGRYSIAMFDCRKVMQASFATWGKHENCRPGTPATSPARSFPASGTSQGLLTSSGSSLGAGKMKTCRRIAFAIFKLKLAVRKQKDLRAVHLTSGYLWDPPSYLMLQHDTCAITGSTPSRNVPPFRDTAWVPPTWQTGAEHRPTLQGPRWDHLLADGSCSERRTSEILNWQSQVSRFEITNDHIFEGSRRSSISGPWRKSYLEMGWASRVCSHQGWVYPAHWGQEQLLTVLLVKPRCGAWENQCGFGLLRTKASSAGSWAWKRAGHYTWWAVTDVHPPKDSTVMYWRCQWWRGCGCWKNVASGGDMLTVSTGRVEPRPNSLWTSQSGG